MDTRWLNLGESLDRLIEMWDSLIEYMKAKPKWLGAKEKTFEDFSTILGNDLFKLHIKFFAKIINNLNQLDIQFQSRTLENQSLKLETHKSLKEFSLIFLNSTSVPVNVEEFKSEEWEDTTTYGDKFLTPEDFGSNIISDLDHGLTSFNSLSLQTKNEFAKIFQPFMVKILSRLVHYLPIADQLINSLDFVTLNMEFDELKKKVLLFNTIMGIVPPLDINALSSEILQLSEENIVLLKNKAKKPSLYL